MASFILISLSLRVYTDVVRNTHNIIQPWLRRVYRERERMALHGDASRRILAAIDKKRQSGIFDRLPGELQE
jgi:hypothetical protein